MGMIFCCWSVPEMEKHSKDWLSGLSCSGAWEIIDCDGELKSIFSSWLVRKDQKTQKKQILYISCTADIEQCWKSVSDGYVFFSGNPDSISAAVQLFISNCLADIIVLDSIFCIGDMEGRLYQFLRRLKAFLKKGQWLIVNNHSFAQDSLYGYRLSGLYDVRIRLFSSIYQKGEIMICETLKNRCFNCFPCFHAEIDRKSGLLRGVDEF